MYPVSRILVKHAQMGHVLVANKNLKQFTLGLSANNGTTVTVTLPDDDPVSIGEETIFNWP
jgi:hypothetical protein